MRPLLLLLLGCAPEPTPGQAPPPASLRLTVDPVTAGSPSALHLRGAAPGETVWFASTTSGFGTWCPPTFGGVCLGILPRVTTLGTAVADATGEATLPFTPPAAAANGRFGVQAAVQGSPIRVSNAVAVWFAPPGSDPQVDGDGDGVSRAGGDCDDGNAAIAPGLVDLVGDRRDADCDGVDGADHDSDGALAPSSGGADCDDDDPTVLPGAPELCDWRDNNCDSAVDEGLDDLDGSGVQDCKEVAVVVSYGFQAHDLTFWLCDDTLPTTRELQELDAVIAATGLSMVRIDEDVNLGVHPDQLAPYSAVLVHNGGWADPLRPGTVDALLAHPDKPLLFMGDDLGLLADRTATTYGRAELFELTHIAAFQHNGNEGFKGLGATLVNPDHPIAQGPFGGASSFAYAADLDHVALRGDGERVIFAKEQVGTPVVWAVEEATRRLAVVQPNVYNNNLCPVSDAAGLGAIEHTVQNALWWVRGQP